VRLQTVTVVVPFFSSVVPIRWRNIGTYSCLNAHVIERKTYQKFLTFISFVSFFNFSPHQVFFYNSSSYQIWNENSDTCSFRSQVKSSQCWNWNLLYHKFWEFSRLLKVTTKEIFALHLILFWKVQMAWRWRWNCGKRWRPTERLAFFKYNLTIWNLPVRVTLTAVKWQIELTECLLSLGTEYYVYSLFPKI